MAGKQKRDNQQPDCITARILGMAKKESGFTLIELLIAIGVGSLIIAAIYAAVNLAQKSTAGVSRKITTQQDARTALEIMAMEVRMASYNRKSPRTWHVDPGGNCAGKVSFAIVQNENNNDTERRKGIQRADADRIAIAMDLGEPPSESIANPLQANEYIEYLYQSDAIMRSVSCGSFQPFLGGTGADTNVKNAEAGIPLFQYFDRNGNNLADASGNVPADRIPSIRRIRITIVAETKEKDSLTGKTKRMTYTTDVLVKNHALCP